MEKLATLFENGNILLIKELDIEYQLIVNFSDSVSSLDHFMKFTPIKINSIDWSNKEINVSVMFRDLTAEEIHDIRVDIISNGY